MIELLILLATLNCGVERADVKTLNDVDASKVDFSKAKEATVSELTKLTDPHATKSMPRQHAEQQVYKVKCILVQCGLEADNDLHLCLKDLNTDAQMIGEIPSDKCSKAIASGYAKDYAKARAFIESLAGKVTKTFRKVGKVITVTGALFFDLKHPKPQRGVAPNQSEIHPIRFAE